MAQERKTSNLVVRTSLSTTDRLVFVSNAASANSSTVKTATITVDNFLYNSANLRANVQTLKITSDLGTPGNSNSFSIEAGTVWIANGVLYYADSSNHVKRVVGSDF